MKKKQEARKQHGLGRGGRQIGLAFCTLAWLGGTILEAQHGRIQGRISDREGHALGAVAIALGESDQEPVITDRSGRFSFDGVPAGNYILTFTLEEKMATATVEVTPGKTIEVDEVLDWRLSIAETMTVYSASRRPERIIESPVAVSAVTPAELRRQSVMALPKIFESLPGAEITQSGVFDFKLNARGINSSMNRRVAVLIDGRDPSMTFLDAQEWSMLAFSPAELASAELVRGPSSALYGTNAFNGFVNLITKSPQESLGGNVRLSAGEQSTRRADFRFAAALPADWYFKGTGSYVESDDFDRSRHETLEYSVPCTSLQPTNCLGLEPIPLPLDSTRISYAGVRFDRDFSRGRSLVIEGGLGSGEGHLWSGPAGRVQFTHLERPWTRVNFNAPHWNLLATTNGRDADMMLMAPGAGIPGFADSDRFKLEFQTNWAFAGDKGRVVGGASFNSEDVTSADPQGVETLILSPQSTDTLAFFGQLDYAFTDRLKLVLAGRWDDHSVIGPQFSPQGALVFSLASNHTLRVSYREAFLTPNYTELFVRVPIAAPIDLSAFEDFCSPHGVACGFDRPSPSLIVGNSDLEPETIDAAEIGYRAILGQKVFLNVEYYRSQAEGFVQIGAPLVSAIFGRINSTYGPYTPPSGLPAAASADLLAALAADLGSNFPFLSNPIVDQPEFAFLTTANFGRIETQGIEIGLDVSLSRRYDLNFSYSWLDFEAREQLEGFPPLVANSPESKVKLGLSYTSEHISASLQYRWVDDFQWVEGILNGPVPSYNVVNLAFNYQPSKTWEVSLIVNNLLDDEHYEFFSGDLLPRHTLVSVGFSW